MQEPCPLSGRVFCLKKKSMTKKEKNKTMLLMALVIFGLWGFAKKKLSPSVEVGEGDFGEFGTDGEFAPSKSKPQVGLGKMPDVSNASDYRPVVIENGCGCG